MDSTRDTQGMQYTAGEHWILEAQFMKHMCVEAFFLFYSGSSVISSR